jgi:TonB family protein
MLEKTANSLQTDGWYVIARGGDLVLRVRPGMQLGEDPAGELSLDPADAAVEFDVTSGGRLVLLAPSNRALEIESGDRTRSVDFGRDSGAQIRLANDVLSIATDFAGPFWPGDPLQVRTVQIAAPPPEPEAPRPARRTPLARPVGKRAPRTPGTAPAADPTFLLVPEPAVGAFARAAPDASPANDAGEARAEDVPGTPSAARRRPMALTILLAGFALASGGVLVLAYLDSTPQPERSPVSEVADQMRDAVEQATPTPPFGSVRRNLARSAPTATAARDEFEMLPATPGPGSPSTVAEAGRQPRSLERLAVEPVSPPAMERAVIADDAPDAPSAMAEPTVLRVDPAGSSGPAEPTRLAVPRVNPEPLGRAAQSVAVARANERDLRAAADALEGGLLMPPLADNAFTLYGRVLESDPDSHIARAGLESVRERLLARARASLASDDIGAAIASLDDAATAGSDRGIVAELRAEATYRQDLLDAMAGKPGTLYPMSELTALRLEPPEYPRRAPARAATSVDIEMTVTENGAVRDVEVLGDAPTYFIRAAKQGVSKWRFAPVLNQGKPVPVRTSVRVTFRRD